VYAARKRVLRPAGVLAVITANPVGPAPDHWTHSLSASGQ